MGHCNLKLLTKNTIFQDSALEGPKLMISHALIQIYVRNISRGLNQDLLPVLLPVLRHKSFAQNFCQGHTLNGYCAKLASNLDAKDGLLTLSDPRQHKKCAFSIFIILTSLRL